MNCPHTDEVVARFLDGDVAHSSPISLEDHANECCVCRRALTQSRHLDAAIAATVEPGFRDPDALVAAAIAASTPAVPTVVRVKRRRWPLIVTAAASFVVGLTVAWRRTPTPTPTPSTSAAALVAPAPRGQVDPFTDPLTDPFTTADQFTIPEQASSPARASAWTLDSRALDAARRAELILASADLPAAVQMLERARALSLGVAPTAMVPGKIAAGEIAARVEAGRVLLASRSRAATAALARALARDDATATALQPILSADREFKARLRRELHERCDRDFAWAAARLADPELDRAVIARCRRDDALADAIAAGARTADRPAERVDFLLELWSALARLGDDGSRPGRADADRAQAWFAGLGPAASALLLARLQGSRSGELRGQCILALAAIADPGAVEPLLALVERPNLHEAQLATYALGMLPQAVTPRLRTALPRSRRASLLWTALAGLGDRTALDLVSATGIPFEPTARLRPEQIAAIAHALRGRDSASPTSLRP